jgi:hypothetical protein
LRVFAAEGLVDVVVLLVGVILRDAFVAMIGVSGCEGLGPIARRHHPKPRSDHGLAPSPPEHPAATLKPCRASLDTHASFAPEVKSKVKINNSNVRARSISDGKVWGLAS